MRRTWPAALAVALAAAVLSSSALGGSTTGFGSSREVHLADPSNGLNVTVVSPESITGFVGYAYNFSLNGTASTQAAAYRVAVVVAPGSDTEARWNGTASVPAGAGATAAQVVIPPDALPFNNANTPFAIELQAANGTVLDSSEFSVDLHYHEPPADGGLLALALASASVWGIVFLYALNLHLTQRKLRARVSALERAQDDPPAEGGADGTEH